MLVARDHAVRDFGERHPLIRIKHPQLHTRAEEALQGDIEVGFLDFALIYRLD